jgi:glycosyltransferase involved in cell wall biosynthesis
MMEHIRSKVCIIGHFGFGKELLNGQTIKTKIITQTLEEYLGVEKIYKIDTCGGICAIPRIFMQTGKAVFTCDNILTFLSDNGLKAVMPMLFFYNIFHKTRIVHLAIGAELARYLRRNKFVSSLMHKIDMIYAETNCLKNSLETDGFINVDILPNCKHLSVLAPEQLQFPNQKPFKLCMFGRVMKEKGIGDAVNVVNAINSASPYPIYTLDIYGQVNNRQVEWFEELKRDFPPTITYKGVVPFDKSVEVLKDYFALLFPTKFFVEGVPGAIIDAYAAGLPVISSRWESFSDVVDDGLTGLGYDFENVVELKSLMLEISNRPEMINSIRVNCLRKAEDFSTDVIMKILKL